MRSIHTITPGMFTTIQDLGRPGFLAQAVCRGGAADHLALRLANRLVGNHDRTAALEFTLTGGEFLFTAAADIALAGAHCAVTITSKDGTKRAVPDSTRIEVQAGERLHIGPLQGSARAYLAIRGGIDVPKVLESRSTHIAARFGGFDGRALRAGDVIQIGTEEEVRLPIAQWPGLSKSPHTIRAVDGAHAGMFGESALHLFWTTSFVVSNQSNRAGVRLEGQAIATPGTGRLTSEGMAPGAVQVPESGNPIALGVDHPTTGGYPVIACIISADLHILGQVRPSDMLRFEKVTLEEARQAMEAQTTMLNSGSTPS